MGSRAERLRNEMVEFQISSRGIFDGRLIKAFQTVPRHMFVPKEDLFSAYSDRPLPIGHGQTISQPYIVAEMCRLSELTGEERVLEIGTGSGYAAAILSMLAAEVFTIERIHSLYENARRMMEKLGYTNVHCICGDGYNGYPDEAPFDVILVSAAPVNLPDNLVRQLSEKGRIVAPVGRNEQYLIRLKRTPEGYKKSVHGAVRFVPLRHGFS